MCQSLATKPEIATFMRETAFAMLPPVFSKHSRRRALPFFFRLSVNV
jgi:hypothetical protein